MKPIFSSVGSNYSRSLMRHALLPGGRNDRRALLTYLEKRYNAQDVQLSYKGREAIALGLAQLNLPVGSFVAVNGYTCYAVFQAVTAVGCLPYYLDPAKDSLNFDAEGLEQALKAEPKIAAIMIQNTMGIPCDIEAIAKVCNAHKLPLVEDLAHSLGMMYSNGQEAGTVGDWAALSFAQYKVIDAVSGGALVSQTKLDITDKPQLTTLRRRLVDPLFPFITGVIRRTYRLGLGRYIQKLMTSLRLMPKPIEGSAKPWHTLTNWHARLTVKALSELETNLAHRQEIAARYRQELPASVQLPHLDGSIYVRWPMLVDDPKSLVDHLAKAGIYVSDIWYDAPVSPIRLLHETNYQTGMCPRAEELSQHMINLPTHIRIDDTAATRIIKEVNTWLKSRPKL